MISTASARPVLQVRDVVSGYEGLTILHGVSAAVADGQLVVIIGPNGAGKSTFLKVLAGFLPAREGVVEWCDVETAAPIDLRELKTSDRCRLGLGYLPQLDNVFPNMSILENLKVGAYLQRRDMRTALEWVFGEFPFLYGRRRQRAGTLSGGQRKLLALARALLTRPKVLLLDEPSAALSPTAADEVFGKLLELRARGLSMLVVEQSARRALALCDYAYVLDMGRNRFEGTGEALLRDDTVVALYLGQRAVEQGEHSPACPAEEKQ